MRCKLMETFRNGLGLVPGLLAIFLAAGCASPAPAPWKFAVFCDGRSDRADDPGAKDGVRWASMKAIAAHAVSQHVQLVVFPGDLSNGATNFGTLEHQWTEWRKDMAPLYDAGIPVYPVRGNHELHQPGSAETWRKIFPELPRNGPKGQEGLTFKVETKNACFVAIDEFAGQPPAVAGELVDKTGPTTGMVSPWAIEQVKQSSKKWVFAYGHEPGYFGHHTDALASDAAGRNALWDALGARGGVYLSGHDHMYVRHWGPEKDGHPVLELVVGCAGAPNYPYDNVGLNKMPATDLFINAAKPTRNTGRYPAYFGYVVITVYPDRLEGEWWALTNYDTTTVKSSPPPATPKFEKLDTFTWPKG